MSRKPNRRVGDVIPAIGPSLFEHAANDAFYGFVHAGMRARSPRKGKYRLSSRLTCF